MSIMAQLASQIPSAPIMKTSVSLLVKPPNPQDSNISGATAGKAIGATTSKTLYVPDSKNSKTNLVLTPVFQLLR